MAGGNKALQILITGGVTQGLLDGLNTARIVLLSFADAVKEVSNTKMGSGFDDFAKIVERTVQNVGKSMTEAEKYFQKYGAAATQGLQAEGAAADQAAAALMRAAEAKKSMAAASKDTGDTGDIGDTETFDLHNVEQLKQKFVEFHAVLDQKKAYDYAQQIHGLYNSLVQLGKIKPTKTSFEEFSNSLDLTSVAAAAAEGTIKRTADGFRSLGPEGDKALNVSEKFRKSLEKYDPKPAEYIRRLYDRLKELGKIKTGQTFEDFYNRISKSARGSVQLNDEIKKLGTGFKGFTEKTRKALHVTKAQEQALITAAQAPSKYSEQLRQLRTEQDMGDKNAKAYATALQNLGKRFGTTDQQSRGYIQTLQNIRTHMTTMAQQAEAMGRHDIAEMFRNIDPTVAVLRQMSGELEVTRGNFEILSEAGKDIFKDVSSEELKEASQTMDLMKTSAKEAEGVLRETFEYPEAQAQEYARQVEKIYTELERLQGQDLTLLDETQLEQHKRSITELNRKLHAYRGFIETTRGTEGFDQADRSVIQLNTSLKDHNQTLKEAQAEMKRQEEHARQVQETYQQLNSRLAELEARDFSIMDKEDTRLVTSELSAAESDLRRIRDHLQDPKAGQQMQDRISELRRETDRWRVNMQKAIEGMDSEPQRQAMKSLADQYGHHTSNINRYKKAVREVTEFDQRRMDQITDKIHRLKEQRNQTNAVRSEIARLSAQHKQLSDGVDTTERVHQRYSETLKGVSKGQSKLNRDLGASRREMTTFEGMLNKVFQRIKQFGAFILAAYVLQGFRRAIRSVVQVLAEFDQALYNLQAIINITAQEAEAMGRTILDVARTTKFSAGEVAEGVVLLGQAGFDAVEAIQAVGAVANLATGTLEDFKKVVDLVTTTVRAFHLETVRSSEIADIFANAINNSKLVIDKLATAFNYVGAAGHQAGLTLNDVSGTLMVLANNGIRASTMGTGLRRMMLQMLAPNVRLRAALQETGQAIGDLNPKIVGWEEALRNLAPLMWDFERDTVDMGKASEFFGTRASQVAAVLMDAVASGGALSEAIEQTREVGSAARMAGLQQEGLEVKFKNLQDRVKNVTIAMGDVGLTGVLKTLVDWMAKATESTENFFREWPEAISITALATVISGLSIAIMAVAKSASLAIPLLKKFWAALLGPVGIISVAIATLVGLVMYFNNRLGKLAEAHAQVAIEIGKGISALEGWKKVVKEASEESERAFSDSLKRFSNDEKELSNAIIGIINDNKLLGDASASSLLEIQKLAGGAEAAGEVLEEAFDLLILRESMEQLERWAKSAEAAIENVSAYRELRKGASRGQRVEFEGITDLENQLSDLREQIKGYEEDGVSAWKNIKLVASDKEIIDSLREQEKVYEETRQVAFDYIEQVSRALTRMAKVKGLEVDSAELDEFLAPFLEKFPEIAEDIEKNVSLGLEEGMKSGIEKMEQRITGVSAMLEGMEVSLNPEELMEFEKGLDSVFETATEFLNFLEDNKDRLSLTQGEIDKMAMDKTQALLREHYNNIIGETELYNERIRELYRGELGLEGQQHLLSREYETEMKEIERHFDNRRRLRERYNVKDVIDAERAKNEQIHIIKDQNDQIIGAYNIRFDKSVELKKKEVEQVKHLTDEQIQYLKNTQGTMLNTVSADSQAILKELKTVYDESASMQMYSFQEIVDQFYVTSEELKRINWDKSEEITKDERELTSLILGELESRSTQNQHFVEEVIDIQKHSNGEIKEMQKRFNNDLVTYHYDTQGTILRITSERIEDEKKMVEDAAKALSLADIAAEQHEAVWGRMKQYKDDQLALNDEYRKLEIESLRTAYDDRIAAVEKEEKDSTELRRKFGEERSKLNKHYTDIQKKVLRDFIQTAEGYYDSLKGKYNSLIDEIRQLESELADIPEDYDRLMEERRYQDLDDRAKYYYDKQALAKADAQIEQALAEDNLEAAKKAFEARKKYAGRLDTEIERVQSEAQARENNITHLKEERDLRIAIKELEIAQKKEVQTELQSQMEQVGEEIDDFRQKLLDIEEDEIFFKVAADLPNDEVDAFNAKLKKLFDDFDGKTIKINLEADQKATKKKVGGYISSLKTKTPGLNRGAKLPGFGGGDIVPAMLEPGEWVIRKEAVKKYGSDFFQALNEMQANAGSVLGTLRAKMGSYVAPQQTIPRFKTGNQVQTLSNFGTLNLTINNEEIGQIYAEPNVLQVLEKQVKKQTRLRGN